MAVLSMAYGAGHRMAAEALAQALGPGVQNLVLRDPASERLYLLAQRKLHGIWALAYSLSERFPGPARLMSRAVAPGARRAALEVEADLVLATHFYPGLWLSGKTRVWVVITDFVPHPLWVARGVERYFVATPETGRLLARWVPRELVRVSGIPVRRMFWQGVPKSEARERLGIPKDAKVAVVNAGAYGVTNILGVVEGLARAGVWVYAIAGRNQLLRERLAEALKGMPGVARGFVQEMNLVLAAGDLIITKAGGIIVSECLASGIPMVFLGSMPGQERGNARMVSALGAGAVARSPGEAVALALRILSSPRVLGEMAKRASALGKPRAALDIAEQVALCCR